MAQRKPVAARHAAEAKRRTRDAARLDADRERQRIDGLRQTIADAVHLDRFARQVELAMTESFAWEPWGMELPPADVTQELPLVRPAVYQPLRIVGSNGQRRTARSPIVPVPRVRVPARARFERQLVAA